MGMGEERVEIHFPLFTDFPSILDHNKKKEKFLQPNAGMLFIISTLFIIFTLHRKLFHK